MIEEPRQNQDHKKAQSLNLGRVLRNYPIKRKKLQRRYFAIFVMIGLIFSQLSRKMQPLLMVVVRLVAVVLGSGTFGLMHNMRPQPPLKTTTGPINHFQPSQEAVHRLRDLNVCRWQSYNNRGNTIPDQRNLGMAEVIGKKADGSTVVLYVAPLFWGSHSGGHSETLAVADVEKFLRNHRVDDDITALHMLVVSQFNVCHTCVKNIQAISASIRQQVYPITLATSIWEVIAYIDPLNPRTWVAPSSPGDITLVNFDRG